MRSLPGEIRVTSRRVKAGRPAEAGPALAAQPDEIQHVHRRGCRAGVPVGVLVAEAGGLEQVQRDRRRDPVSAPRLLRLQVGRSRPWASGASWAWAPCCSEGSVQGGRWAEGARARSGRLRRRIRAGSVPNAVAGTATAIDTPRTSASDAPIRPLARSGADRATEDIETVHRETSGFRWSVDRSSTRGLGSDSGRTRELGPGLSGASAIA